MSSEPVQRYVPRSRSKLHRDRGIKQAQPSHLDKHSCRWYIAVFFSHVTVIIFFFIIGSLHARSLQSSIASRRTQEEECPVDGEAFTRMAPMTDYFYSDGTRNDQKDAPKIALPVETNAYLAGMARVSRIDLLQKLDIGFPLQASTSGNREIVLLYDHRRSLPTGHNAQHFTYYHDTLAAIENCRQLRVVSMDPKFYSSSATDDRCNRTCLALHGHTTEPFPIITKWKRKSRKSTLLSESSPSTNYIFESKFPLPPKPITVSAAQDALEEYLTRFPEVMADMQLLVTPLAKRFQNLVVIMVVTTGHLPLLMNYLCACEKAGVDTSRIVVFCTDVQSYQVLVNLPSVSAFDLSTLWASSGLANEAEYGSLDYARIMMSKIYAVHLVNRLGHDVLFQDVDMVPFKSDYIDYLVDSVAKKRYPGFDVYMQYDHAAQHPLYAPYGGNSGLFFLKHNSKTLYLMSRLIRSGDLVLKTRSHQATLIMLLSEMASQYGLRIKVLSSESNKFPLGYHFHHDWDYMRDLVQERTLPYMFHMNWNNDREMKHRFLQQLGFWYVKEECQILTEGSSLKRYNLQFCCVAEPNPVCHYSDKPSKLRECKTYPAVETNDSFW